MTTADDFNNGPLADLGVTVSRTPVTVTTSFSGQKTYSDGSAAMSLVVSGSNPDYGSITFVGMLHRMPINHGMNHHSQISPALTTPWSHSLTDSRLSAWWEDCLSL